MNFKSIATAAAVSASLLIPQVALANPPGNPNNPIPCGVGNLDKWFCDGSGSGTNNTDLEANFTATSFCELSADNLDIDTTQTGANTSSGTGSLEYITSGAATLELSNIANGTGDNVVGDNSGFTIDGDVDAPFTGTLGDTVSGTTSEQEGELDVTGFIESDTAVFESGTYQVVATLTCTTD